MHSADHTADARAGQASIDAETTASRDRMALNEMEALRRLRVYIDCYVSFPTAHNAGLITSQMTVYQNAWMNGRERILED